MHLSRDGYFLAGVLSSFPDVEAQQVLCNPPEKYQEGNLKGCKVFHVSKEPLGEVTELEVAESMTTGLNDQVLVFKYKGKMHGVDQRCPHSSAPLSDGMIFDIEDFGLSLSSGITCPKHMWSFDLHTGLGDRGSYKLKTWQVQLRPPQSDPTDTQRPGQGIDATEVWVRRRPRIG